MCLKKIIQKFSKIQAYIFDWDGVFNAGIKNSNMQSSFSEIDAMGINLLRFSHFLQKKIPIISIISGANNLNAKKFSQRENFNIIYTGIKNKKLALNHFSKKYQLQKSEIAFFFDDVIDLSIAQQVGLRIMVKHNNANNDLLNDYVQKKQWTDYITKNHGGKNAIRETTELLLHLSKNYDKVLSHRINYTSKYQMYLTQKLSLIHI